MSGLKIITANRLRDGLAVFLSKDGQWVENIAAARLAHNAEEAAELQQLADQAQAENLITGAYLIAVAIEENGIRAISTREYIRSTGPSIGISHVSL